MAYADADGCSIYYEVDAAARDSPTIIWPWRDIY